MRCFARHGILPIAFAALLPSQSFDPNALLASAMEKIERGFNRQRRFTCDAFIVREFYRTDPRRALVGRDRLHVEVAVFDGRQLFSWPGAGAFRFQTLQEMVGGGASGSGEFGPFAASFLADSDPASIRFHGAGDLAEYTYDVPLAASHYLVGSERTAYEGSLFVDPKTGDLRRLVIRVTDPPAGSVVVHAEVDTTYEADAGGPDLFPAESTLTMALDGDGEAVNRVTYRGCRVFTGESTLSFGPAPTQEQGQSPTRQRVPAGLSVRSTMITPIDSRTSFAGDAVEARVLDPVKHGKRVVIPKGAVLRGRIVRLEQQYLPGVSVKLSLRFDSVEFNGAAMEIALAARPNLDAVIPDPWQSSTPVTPAFEGVASIQVFGTDRLRLDNHVVSIWETH